MVVCSKPAMFLATLCRILNRILPFVCIARRRSNFYIPRTFPVLKIWNTIFGNHINLIVIIYVCWYDLLILLLDRFLVFKSTEFDCLNFGLVTVQCRLYVSCRIWIFWHILGKLFVVIWKFSGWNQSRVIQSLRDILELLLYVFTLLEFRVNVLSRWSDLPIWTGCCDFAVLLSKNDRVQLSLIENVISWILPCRAAFKCKIWIFWGLFLLICVEIWILLAISMTVWIALWLDLLFNGRLSFKRTSPSYFFFALGALAPLAFLPSVIFVIVYFLVCHALTQRLKLIFGLTYHLNDTKFEFVQISLLIWNVWIFYHDWFKFELLFWLQRVWVVGVVIFVDLICRSRFWFCQDWRRTFACQLSTVCTIKHQRSIRWTTLSTWRTSTRRLTTVVYIASCLNLLLNLLHLF